MQKLIIVTVKYLPPGGKTNARYRATCRDLNLAKTYYGCPNTIVEDIQKIWIDDTTRLQIIGHSNQGSILHLVFGYTTLGDK